MRKVLIMDIDETLVYSRSRKPFTGCNSFEDTDGYVCHTIARPGAKEFLQEITDKDIDLISVTQGVVPFQIMVLGRLGLLDFFQDYNQMEDGEEVWDTNIFGWKSVSRNSVTKPNLEGCKWVMVDNLAHDDWTLREKMYWIGSEFDPELNFVKCEEFRNDKAQDLRELIPRIELLLSRQ